MDKAVCRFALVRTMASVTQKMGHAPVDSGGLVLIVRKVHAVATAVCLLGDIPDSGMPVR